MSTRQFLILISDPPQAIDFGEKAAGSSTEGIIDRIIEGGHIEDAFAMQWAPVVDGKELPGQPLEMFANREMAPRGVDRQTYDGFKLRRMGTFCTDPVHTHLPPNRTHPSCCVATSRKPKFWGCRWHDTLRVRHGIRSSCGSKRRCRG